MTDWTQTEQALHDAQRAALKAFEAVLTEAQATSGYDMITATAETFHDEDRPVKFAMALTVVSDASTLKTIWDFIENLNGSDNFGKKQKLFKQELSDLFTTEAHHGIE